MADQHNEAQSQAPATPATILVSIPIEEWNETRAIIKQTNEMLAQMKADKGDEFMTPKEVCDTLKIGKCTFYSYVNKGKIKTSKLDKKLLIKRADLYEAIENGTL
ncbi:MAG: helix-turn-helix domain-containing protein [Rikenellaceae bacterium]